MLFILIYSEGNRHLGFAIIEFELMSIELFCNKESYTDISGRTMLTFKVFNETVNKYNQEDTNPEI